MGGNPLCGERDQISSPSLRRKRTVLLSLESLPEMGREGLPTTAGGRRKKREPTSTEERLGEAGTFLDGGKRKKRTNQLGGVVSLFSRGRGKGALQKPGKVALHFSRGKKKEKKPNFHSSSEDTRKKKPVPFVSGGKREYAQKGEALEKRMKS